MKTIVTDKDGKVRGEFNFSESEKSIEVLSADKELLAIISAIVLMGDVGARLAKTEGGLKISEATNVTNTLLRQGIIGGESEYLIEG